MCSFNRMEESPATPPPSVTPSGILWNEHKAGLSGVDKEHVNRIVLEASRGSRFYTNEERKDAELSAKIVQLKKRVEQVKLNQHALKTAEKKIATDILPKLEAQREKGKTILHLDMDCTYFDYISPRLPKESAAFFSLRNTRSVRL